MKRNIVIVSFLVLVVAALLFTASEVAQPRVARAQERDDLIPTKMNGKPAPEFTLETLDGKKMTLADLRGKVIVLNFWATWCTPCKVEMPWLIDFQKQYASQGVQIVGIAEDDSGKEKISAFAREMQVNYPILLDEGDVADKYGNIENLPTTFYISRTGTIVESASGIAGKPDIDAAIQKALSASSGEAKITGAVSKERQ